MPPIVCLEPSATFVSPSSSSISKSCEFAVTCFLHIPAYSSRGCPLTYTPRTSFSYSSFSSLLNSSKSGILIWNSDLALSSTISNNDIWPDMASFPCLTSLSRIWEYTPIICRLFAPNVSIAPALIRFSTILLLRELYSLPMKSCMLPNLPFCCLSAIIASITGLPSALIAENPKRIEFSSVVNPI